MVLESNGNYPEECGGILFEMLVPTYQTTRTYVAQDNNLYSPYCSKIKPQAAEHSMGTSCPLNNQIHIIFIGPEFSLQNQGPV